MHPDWARKIRDACIAARTPFFFKQFGEFQDGSLLSGVSKRDFIVLNDGRFAHYSYDFDQDTRNRWPHFRPTMMARVGKSKAARTLDGRTWDQFPEPRI